MVTGELLQYNNNGILSTFRSWSVYKKLMFASHGGADETVAFLLPTDKNIVNSTASHTSREAPDIEWRPKTSSLLYW